MHYLKGRTMFVIRKGREFEENETYNELGHWSPDGKWHHIDDGTLEEMEKKAHYLNGGVTKEIEELQKAEMEKEYSVNFKVKGELSYTIKAKNKEEAEELARELYEETTSIFTEYYGIIEEELYLDGVLI